MNGIPDAASPAVTGVLRGCPVQIVALAEDSSPATSADKDSAAQVHERFVFVGSAFRDVVSRPELCGLRVMVLSVAGAFRKGKSFLLDFVLRFLQHAERKLEANPNWAPEASDDSWFGDLDSPLEGLSSRDTKLNMISRHNEIG